MTTKSAQSTPLSERPDHRLASIRQAVIPGRRAWRGAAWGAVAAFVLILAVIAYALFAPVSPLYTLAGFALLTGVFAIVGGLLTLLWWMTRRVPVPYMWVLVSTALVLAFMAMTALSVPLGVLAVGAGILAVASLLGAATAELVSGGWREATRARRVVISSALTVGMVGAVGGGAWLLDAGTPLTYPDGVPTLADSDVPPLELPDPSQPGRYTVRALTYGSGTDRHRPEYGANADILTETVDGSALVEGWSALRTRYWGFDATRLPLNGRVWYPEGDGPFPLVLILHGQHPMEDASDPGYAYLGDLLASRGFVVASVDQNFLNLSPLVDVVVAQALRGENDLRAWLLLEHLRRWHTWQDDPASPFYGKLDLDRIALVGHSKGGEAVAIAAAFNRLPYYPDDASVQFDYDFGIQSVIGLAPVDGNYQPAGQPVHLTDVSYLVLHGAHDMDVFTFQGSRQYERVRFEENSEAFKAGVYIYGANHGQFNTRWGHKDLFEPLMRVFNLAQLMPPAQQRQIAKVTISAFLEDTLRDETDYRALFQDIRRGRDWLPDTIYLHQYTDANTQMVSTYEEDIDLTTTTLPGGRIVGENLTDWREGPVEAKWQTIHSQAVYLGWDIETTADTASYTVSVPSLSLTEDSVLVFAMAAAEAVDVPIDVMIEVMDSAGAPAHLPLSHVTPLSPPLEARLGKSAFMSVTPTWEPVLHHFEFPLADFVAQNAAFVPEELAQVRFRFDRTPSGVVVLDDLGFRR